ncbi:hypothetical protein [Alterinioella nitratireducens]|uniref:hypothetical protein n=1 Tax=Alterinioella nitratireducens TaxID=2735915 RepID=UPI00155670F9|nr:hypothetical protein [Alterinioella nitratireducens]NPD18081.1 hypothetical protein [Alterinioella nitratireducens]
MTLSGTTFYSYSNDGIDLTIWVREGGFFLAEQNETLGHYPTVEEAVGAAVSTKKFEGFAAEATERLADLASWEPGFQVNG